LQQPQQLYVQQAPVHSSFGLEQNQQQPLQQHIPQTYPPQQPDYTLAHHSLQQPSQSFQADPYQQLGFGQQPAFQQQYPPYPEMPVQTRNRGVRTPAEVGSYNYDNGNVKEEEQPAWEHPQPIAQAQTPARRGRKPKSETANGGAPPTPMKKMDTGGIEVKTKFPTARIKRIMQADEDVGKVAQVTPVVMGMFSYFYLSILIFTDMSYSQSTRAVYDPPHLRQRRRRQTARLQARPLSAHEVRRNAR
jgi:hypothetical protein